MVTLCSQLLDIRLGPGAAILPKDVKRIHMDFASKINDGHFGPRKFWKIYLPRLKYHNPAVSMTVNRTTDQKGPATLTVFFTSPADSISPVDSSVNERTEVLDMKHKQESEILGQLMKITRAKQVKPTEAEELELRQIEEEKVKSEEDRRRMAAVTGQRRREAELLAQAKASIAGAEAMV